MACGTRTHCTHGVGCLDGPGVDMPHGLGVTRSEHTQSLAALGRAMDTPGAREQWDGHYSGATHCDYNSFDSMGLLRSTCCGDLLAPRKGPGGFIGERGLWPGRDDWCTPPPPPCISYALVQPTVGAGTVLIWDLILIRYQT